MHFLKAFTLAIVAVGISSCAPARPDFEWSSPSAADRAQRTALAPAMAPFITAYETMTSSLPQFALQRGYGGALAYGEVSVVRDVSFDPDSSILSWDQVQRLDVVQKYLIANPATTVRITAHGDNANASERTGNLATARAQAVGRALTVDMGVQNDVAISAANAAAGRSRAGTAEIILVMPPAQNPRAADGELGPPPASPERFGS